MKSKKNSKALFFVGLVIFVIFMFPLYWMIVTA